MEPPTIYLSLTLQTHRHRTDNKGARSNLHVYWLVYFSICCHCLQEARYEDALQKFLQVQHVGGYRPDLAYNIALCQYMLKQYGAAHSCVGDIIAKGIKEHPGVLQSHTVFS